jgi:hypothetical protein
VIRQGSRRGDEFLRFDFQEFESVKRISIWGHEAGTEGDSDERHLPNKTAILLQAMCIVTGIKSACPSFANGAKGAPPSCDRDDNRIEIT